VDAELLGADGVNLKAIPLTLTGAWPYVSVLHKSFGDAGGLFLETQGAVTEDLHTDGVYDYTDAEFADISGDLHGKVFATLVSSTTTPYWMFSIKHGDDIGIVSPYCAASPTMPGKLQVYTYDADYGMPTGSPTEVTFSAISGTTVSVIVSLAKIGTKYHAMHLAYTRTVSGTAGEIALWGVIHRADGSIDSATKVEKTLTYDTLKVPSAYLGNLGYATQNTWTVRIEKAGTVWTSLEAQVHNHIHGDPGVHTTSVHEVTIDGVVYYEATSVDYGVDTETPTISFRFTAGSTTTAWSAEYAFGEASVLLDGSSSTAVCYIERANKELGYGIRMQFGDDDPAVWKGETELASDASFTTKLHTTVASENLYYYLRPFLRLQPVETIFVDRAVTDIYFHARAQDCNAVPTAWSTALHLVLSDTIESVGNRDDLGADTVVGEAWDSDYVQTKVTPWSDETLQLSNIGARMQVRNVANADTLFTAFQQLTTTVVDGETTEEEENELVALTTSGATQKALTDASSGGFYATSATSGEDGVSFLTYDWDTGVLAYHATFDDAAPADLSYEQASPAWFAIVNLKGTLCAVVCSYFGTIYYRPLAGGSWQTVTDGDYASTYYMSVDPWGKSLYFAREEYGLGLSYLVSVQAANNSIWFQEG